MCTHIMYARALLHRLYYEYMYVRMYKNLICCVDCTYYLKSVCMYHTVCVSMYVRAHSVNTHCFSPVQRLQQIHIDNSALQRNLQDTKQQLESLDVSAKISQKDRESVSQEVQKQYEEDWMKLKQESSEWRAKYNEVCGKVRCTR